MDGKITVGDGLVYPLLSRTATFWEKLAVKTRILPGFCPVCGRLTLMNHWQENYRDTGWCFLCKSSNRQRQMAVVLWDALRRIQPTAFFGLPALKRFSTRQVAIYNTEAFGAVHQQLSGSSTYTCSEYIGADHQAGDMVHGVRHEDLQKLSFADSSFDVVLSADVFEHIPLPYDAHCEVFRILKPGGRHIFTVPFYQTEFQDEVRAKLDEAQIVHLKPPVYHTNPLQKDSILVYTIFSLEMLVKLNQIGFRTHLYRLYNPWFGILGQNGLVFEAMKL